MWVAAAAVLFMVFHRDSSKRGRRDGPPSPAPSPSADAETRDTEARVVRDGEIAAAVNRSLRANPSTRRQDIEVDSDEGIVTLSGHAPAAAARDAEAMARHIDGVKEVVNAIEVEGADASSHEPHVGPPAGPGGVPIPPMPPLPGGLRPGVSPETVKKLLREAHEALSAGEAGAAMGKFVAVLGMDPSNEEARRGMRDATKLLVEHGAAHVRQRRGPSPEPSGR